MPDRATRYLVAELLRRGVESFCLVDGDPCGFSIYLTYRIGSWQMIHEENLVCQKLRLYGVRPSQFRDLKLRKEVLLGFKKSDYSRIESMRQKILGKVMRNKAVVSVI